MAEAEELGVVSQVQYIYQPGGPYPGPCGYCHGDDEQFYLDGVWSEKMSAQDFQELVDRGCQRSGKFVYLPANKLTCCPQYIFRLDVSTFRASKSQRRAVRRFNEYLLKGRQEDKKSGDGGGGGAEADTVDTQTAPEAGKVDTQTAPEPATAPGESQVKKSRVVTPGSGADPTKPPCRKAKEIRRERRAQKLANRRASKDMDTSTQEGGAASASKKLPSSHPPPPPDLIELVRLPDPRECQHKVEVKLLCTNPVSREFWASYDESYEVFRKFQMVVHREPQEKCDRTQYMQFIVCSPLYPEESPPGTGLHYGSYHQQYWIDDKLLMIGVLDIIPKGVLCNYLFYDPDMRFLAPGVYSAVREIAFNYELFQRNPALQFYYMGYYVHHCPKMNYKRHYDSASILCPETYEYIPLDKARSKLDVAKYCRLSDNQTYQETFTDEDVDKVLVRSGDGKAMEYAQYRASFGNHRDSLVQHYLKMVGRDASRRMLLYFSGLVPGSM